MREHPPTVRTRTEREWDEWRHTGAARRLPTRSGWAGVVRRRLTAASRFVRSGGRLSEREQDRRVMAALVSRALAVPLDEGGLPEHLGLTRAEYGAAILRLADDGAIDPGSHAGRVYVVGPALVKGALNLGVDLPDGWRENEHPAHEQTADELTAAFAGLTSPDD